jgi:tetratricopeptide (TPR) repeat protein
VERGEERLIRARHAAYYLGLAEEASRQLGGAEQEVALNRLDAAHNNLRAVLEWHAHSGDADAALRLVAALWKFWHIRSYQTEAGRWIALALGLAGRHDPAVRAYVLYGAGWIAVDRGDRDQARGWFDESLALFRSLHDRRGIAESLHGVGAMLQATGDSAEALALFEESLALYRELDDAEGIAWSLDHLGRSALGLRDHARARQLFESSRGIFCELGHRWGQAISLDHLGLADLALGHHMPARERFSAALCVFQELANSWGVASSFDHLGYVALATGDPDLANVYFGQSMELNVAEADRDGMVRSLAGLASLAVARGRLERAACLFGAFDGLAGAGGVHMEPVVADIYRRDLAELQRHLNPDAMARAWARGQSMSLAAVVAYVHDETP